jgi:hypothetical protein
MIVTRVTTGIVGGMADAMTTTMMIDPQTHARSGAGHWRLNAKAVGILPIRLSVRYCPTMICQCG